MAVLGTGSTKNNEAPASRLRPSPRRRHSALIATLIAVGGMAACGGGGGDGNQDDRDESGSEAAQTTVEPTTTSLSATQEVEAAFLAFNSMMDRLREAPDPDDPEIAQRASGETLAGIVDAQTTLQTTGFSARFGERDSVEVLSVTLVDADTALVRDCQVEELTEVNASGEQNGPFVHTFWTEWTLIKDGAAWLVDSSDGLERREGEHPCE